MLSHLGGPYPVACALMQDLQGFQAVRGRPLDWSVCAAVEAGVAIQSRHIPFQHVLGDRLAVEARQYRNVFHRLVRRQVYAGNCEVGTDRTALLRRLVVMPLRLHLQFPSVVVRSRPKLT